jgi:uncharacterized membrane protein YphA (DoxX/SURF4 family)
MDAQVLLRVFYASLLAMSTWTKVRHPRAFAAGIADYGLVPVALTAPAAWIVAGTEGVLGLALLTVDGPLPWIGTCLVLAAFSSAQVFNMGRGKSHACHCFGNSERIGTVSVTRALILTLISLAMVTVVSDQVALTSERIESPLTLVAVAAAGAIARLDAIVGRLRRAARRGLVARFAHR